MWNTVVRALCLTVAMSVVGAQNVRGQSKSNDGLSNLTDLIDAAKKEGELVLYSTPSDAVTRRILDAFTAKYGVKAEFLRLASTTLSQRFQAEAASGATQADVVLNAGDIYALAQDGIAKGWVRPITDAELPVINSGEFPSKYNRGATALVQILPAYVAYNTDKVKGSDIPHDWPDLLKPLFTDQILISSPLAADFNLEMFVKLRNKYDDEFLRKLVGQVHRRFDSGIPAIQALAAGEGLLMFPISFPGIQTMITKGGPLAGALFDYTTGAEMQVMLVSPSLAKHPNAARLFADYVMSKEGNTVVNADPGGFTIYQPSRLPKEYQAPQLDSVTYKEEVAKLLGYK